MHYSNAILIRKPLNRVIELFDNPENMKQWQPGFQRFEPLSGIPGQPGAKSKLVYQMGNRRVELIETILVRDLLKEFSGTYETPGFWNRLKNEFVPVDENTTKWVMESEFKFMGIFKLFGWMMTGSFRRRTKMMMENFKRFAENT